MVAMAIEDVAGAIAIADISIDGAAAAVAGATIEEGWLLPSEVLTPHSVFAI